MDNLYIYHRGAEVPEEAKKKITAGRLNGFTDINPMWRIKKLTEIFGAVGFGWRYEVVNQEMFEGVEGQKSLLVDINLYVKRGNEWSEAIFGTGGADFLSKQKGMLYQDNECKKKAITDALSVACKQLGIGASVYFSRDKSKYNGVDISRITEEEANRLYWIAFKGTGKSDIEDEEERKLKIQERMNIYNRVLEQHGYCLKNKKGVIEARNIDKMCYNSIRICIEEALAEA